MRVGLAIADHNELENAGSYHMTSMPYDHCPEFDITREICCEWALSTIDNKEMSIAAAASTIAE